jgi:hypothetical protein
VPLFPFAEVAKSISSVSDNRPLGLFYDAGTGNKIAEIKASDFNRARRALERKPE